jgi:NH3-dependent NAD+ synthetase
VLDAILEDFIEDYKTPQQIAHDRGFDEELVKRVVRMMEKSEYKRQQAAPVLKVTPKAFGAGRRFPIAAKIEI